MQFLNLRSLLSGVCFALLLLAEAALAAPESVNVNSADAETIASVLDGVGISRAQAIVEFRTQNGAFSDPYELTSVKGIGDRTVEINEDRIRLRD